ncbi:MAG: hypothetical protein J1E96_02165 [Ruminococcus sp.]|nr:hypothetical protein [Ruminococcus sp.]
MKITKKLISTALATVMVASTLAVGGFSASAAAAKVKKPTGVKVKNQTHVLKVTWKKVKGATKYKVYRGSKVVATTKKASYKDYNVKAGKKYTYKVKAVKGKKVSTASKKVTATRINNTIIKNVVNNATSVSLNWTTRAGATKYQVYRKTTGAYARVKTVTGSSYTDTNVVSGTKYSYKIYCVNGKTGTKSLASTAKSIVYLAKVTGVQANETKDTKAIEVKWNAVKGAKSYNVYRMKAGDASYKKVASVTSTSYTDKALSVNPTAYAYQVYAVNGSNTSVASKEVIAPYAPKTAGVNRYYFDENNNPTVVIDLKVGEQYTEGKALVEYFSLQGLYKVEVVEGKDVVTVSSDAVIKAVKAGTAKVKVTPADSLLDSYKNRVNDKANSLLDKAVTEGSTAKNFDISTKSLYVVVNVK